MALSHLEIPVAHSGELHAGDLVILAPLLVLAAIGIVWMVRGARRADDPTEEPDGAEGASLAGPIRPERGRGDEPRASRAQHDELG